MIYISVAVIEQTYTSLFAVSSETTFFLRCFWLLRCLRFLRLRLWRRRRRFLLFLRRSWLLLLRLGRWRSFLLLLATRLWGRLLLLGSRFFRFLLSLFFLCARGLASKLQLGYLLTHGDSILLLHKQFCDCTSFWRVDCDIDL